MCLNFVKESLKSFVRDLDVREDGYIWLWKVFDIDKDENLIAQFNEYTFYEGKNTAIGKIIKNYDGDVALCQYKPGFHCFISEAEAASWSIRSRDSHSEERIVVPVKVRKKWITAYGYQGSHLVVVCDHIII